jgi:cytoskeleton protein RodZ
VLREAREKLGLSVADAADQTKLAPRQIEALEADDYKSLPEMAFVRGFVRSYAKILHLDSQPLLAMLPQAIVPNAAQVTRASVEVPFPDAYSPRAQNLIWLGAALLLAVMVVVFAVWHYTSPRSQTEPEQTHPVEMAIALPSEATVVTASDVPETVVEPSVQTPPAKPVTPEPIQPVVTAKPPQPVAAPVAVPAIKSVQPAAASAVKATQPVVAGPGKLVAPVELPVVKQLAPVSSVKNALPVSAAASAPPKAAGASASTVVRLAFDEESWVEVRDANDNIVSSQINLAGSELNLKGQGPFTLVVGHASTSRLFHKGKQVDLAPYTSSASDVARLTLE